VLLFLLSQRGKQLFELRVRRLGGIAAVFLDAKFLVFFQVLQ